MIPKMIMMTGKSAIVNKKGMVTIPAKLRKKHDLREGSEVAFVELEGAIVLIPILDFESLRPFLPTRKQMEKIYDESRGIELKLEMGE